MRTHLNEGAVINCGRCGADLFRLKKAVSMKDIMRIEDVEFLGKLKKYKPSDGNEIGCPNCGPEDYIFRVFSD